MPLCYWCFALSKPVWGEAGGPGFEPGHLGLSPSGSTASRERCTMLCGPAKAPPGDNLAGTLAIAGTQIRVPTAPGGRIAANQRCNQCAAGISCGANHLHTVQATDPNGAHQFRCVLPRFTLALSVSISERLWPRSALMQQSMQRGRPINLLNLR